MTRKNIFAIIGSASTNSSNLKLVEYMAGLTKEYFNITIFDKLHELPHFNPELSLENTPQAIISFRESISKADGLIFCTPEYIFSIPSGLKNCIEWCVSTTVFSGKPTGIITASAQGEKAHAELMLVLHTVECKFIDTTTLLIQGIKGKISTAGAITDAGLAAMMDDFIAAFKNLVDKE
jgi:NAD(P)H-dependent FMN reductase